MRYQNATTGLFPAESCEVNVASLRDSIYCAVAIWSLYQAYRYSESKEENNGHVGCSFLFSLQAY